MSKRNSSAVARLKQDYIRLKRDPVPYIVAEPLPSNLLEWHYVVRGPDDSSYKGGLYHGKLVFPSEFPFKPPSIYMTTPNGRFKTDTRLCLSISDYHPDTWNPAWSVSTILTGLLSFMLERSPTLGSIETSDWDKKQFAYRSLEFNLKSRVFCDLFPELKSECEKEIERRKFLAENQANDPQEDRSALDSQAVNYGVFGNVVVIGGFAAFAFVVRYVLQTMAALE
eukprot:TRINITY_DN6281_c0_g1_i1.p1 TRINITY_DN6281_c0_g1~~TRINITY_DN6281_c0_g1_i1.p1  ORF type:complete len:225 (-),score=46.12 TRINITY_DN6281_c0_g1_i1:185-859(-)